MLETLYAWRDVRDKPYLAFVQGFAFSIIAIGLASVLFHDDPALVTVAFTALLLYPTVSKLLKEEQEAMARTRVVDKFIRRQGKLLLIYALIFLGVLLGYGLLSLMLPQLATNALFESQVGILKAMVGNASVYDAGDFMMLFTHNFGVLILIFLSALLIGDGGIFLLVWNASVWGTIFGNYAKAAALTGLNPYILFTLIMLSVIPHTILEALSYMTAALSGGVTSRTLLKYQHSREKSLGLLYSMSVLLLLAVGILAVGCFVEQYVLNNNDVYARILELGGFR